MICPSLDRHLGCRPVVAAREPSNVARRCGFAFSADGALALQHDNDRVVVGGEILANRGAWVETIVTGTKFLVGAITLPEAPENTRTSTPGSHRTGTASPARSW
jgi:hypothetical protein